MLEELRQRATVTLDSTRLNVHELKRAVVEHFSDGTTRAMRVKIVSFGFKHGPLTEADLVFDVRFLPNPHFDPVLKHRTGLDPLVSTHVRSHADAIEFENRVVELLHFLIPRYAAEGKVYLTIGVGCTGGQHRSVAITEALASRLEALGGPVTIDHRDRRHWSEQPG
jgi:UPF0042 nucleotide-binding protein